MTQTLIGEIVHGDKVGRTLGFPTANLRLLQDFPVNSSATELAQGVYTCVAYLPEFDLAKNKLAGKERIVRTNKLASNGFWAELEVNGNDIVEFKHAPVYAGLLHFGSRATFDDEKLSWEVYLYDFDAEIYGKDMLVLVGDFLRPSQKFASIDDLAEQMQRDKAEGANKLFL